MTAPLSLPVSPPDCAARSAPHGPPSSPALDELAAGLGVCPVCCAELAGGIVCDLCGHDTTEPEPPPTPREFVTAPLAVTCG
jgi:hypothetical protein